MSQTASFLTNKVFPGLLMGCGCLGLLVVNYLGQHPLRSRPGKPRPDQVRSRQDQPLVSMAPVRVRRVAVGSSGARGPSGKTVPGVTSLDRRPRPTAHHMNFAKGRTQVVDIERERLRIFLAAAKPGSDSRVTVVGQGVGPRGRRRAQRRVKRVLALLRQFGVAASIADSKVTPGDGGAVGSAVTIEIRKR